MKVLCDTTLGGFYAVTKEADHLHLSHLYVKPQIQCQGIGSQVMMSLIERSDTERLPIRLGALKGSRSNTFYQRHGFAVTTEDQWDNYYERPIGKRPS